MIGAGTSGGHSPANYTYFVGRIDDVRIYNRALSQAEVLSLFRREIGPKPVINLLGANPIEIYKGTSFIDPGATVVDDKDSGLSVVASGTVNSGTVGSYIITYSATDSDGHEATPVTRTVNVVDSWPDDPRNLLPSFTNYGFDLGTFEQWSIRHDRTPWSFLIKNDPLAEGGKAMFFEEWALGVCIVSPNFTAVAGSYYEARFYRPGNISSCKAIVIAGSTPTDINIPLGHDHLAEVSVSSSTGYVTTQIDLTPFAGQVIRVGFFGGNLQADYAKVFAPISSPDIQAPVITLIGDNPKEIFKGSLFTDPGATVTDNVDPTRTITGSGTVNTATVGIYTVTYTAQDVAGNLALPVERTVNVVLDPAADEDGDGISNGGEISGGTNPYQRDSDGDGVTDPKELADGTNPNSASSFNPLSKGLVAYYPLNGDIDDASGNGRHGVNVRAGFATDRLGRVLQSFRVDGAAKYGRVPIGHEFFNDNFTISVWTKFDHFQNNYPTILEGENHFFGFGGLGPIYENQQGRISYYDYGIPFDSYAPRTQLISSQAVSSGQWHHVVVTKSGSNSSIWINGNLSQSVNSLESSLAVGAYLNIGNSNGFGEIDDPSKTESSFIGSIDDIRIYSRALSANEVGQLFVDEAGNLDTDGDGLTDAWEKGYGRYQIVPGNFTWDQAKADAEARGGHLVTITSQDEWNMIWSLLGPSWGSTVYWMGGTDQGTDGNWRWVTGENWSFNRWYPSQPSGGGEHQLLSSGNLPDGQPGWNDGFGMYQPGNFGGYLLEFGYPTDPNLADTDGDGFNDKVESLGGGDPNNPASLPRLIANNDTVDRDGRSGSSTAIALSQLLGNDQYITATPPTVSLPSRTTAQGGSVLLENGWVIYTGLSGLASSAGDSFGYRITDSLGNKADGMVFLNAGIYSSGVNIVRVVGATPPATGVISYFAVIPNKRYTVYATSSLSPVNWSNLGTFTSDSKGQLAVPDPIVASSRFYKMEVLFP